MAPRRKSIAIGPLINETNICKCHSILFLYKQPYTMAQQNKYFESMNGEPEEFDQLVDEALSKINTDPQPETETKSDNVKKRKSNHADNGSGGEKKKAKRRVKRVPSTSVFAKEMKKMNLDGEQALHIDPNTIEKEIKDAELNAVRMLDELKEFLDRSSLAAAATEKYSQLAAQMEKHRSQSAVIDKVSTVFQKVVGATAAARESCAKLPAEFAKMLLRHESFMRASASSLVPTGLSVYVPSTANNQATSNALITTSNAATSSQNSMAVVTFNGPQSRNTFRLVADTNTRARTSDLKNSYLATSMMHANYDPRNTVTATNAARRDAQRRVAELQTGAEIIPDLFGARQIESSKLRELAAAQQLAVEYHSSRPTIEDAK